MCAYVCTSVWRLKSVESPPHGWVYGLVGEWVGSCEINKILINLDLIKIVQFCLKIYGNTPPMGRWMGTLMGGSYQITKFWRNIDLILIIQFCLKAYDVWRHPHLWMGGWVGWWMGSCQITKSNKAWPNWDNSMLFEDLWCVETLPPMGGRVDWWVSSCHMTKNKINLDLIEIIQIFILLEDLWFVETSPPVGRCMGVWVVQWVGSCQNH